MKTNTETKTDTKPMQASKTNADITALLRARNTLLWVMTREEARVENALIESAAAAKYEVRFWDCATGLTDSTGKTIRMDGQAGDPQAVLNHIRDKKDRAVYILRDLHKWFDPTVLRSVRSLARSLQKEGGDTARAIVLLTPSGEVPPELAGHATVIDYPIPDRAEIEKILAEVIESLPEFDKDGKTPFRANAAPNGVREAAIDAAVGLTAEEAANCYARSLVTSKKIDPAIVSAEKKRVISREKVLTWIDPDPRGMDGVGGLDLLKDWLRARKAGFSARAREYGLPAPKGCLLVGIPGCGKSLTAKCIATAWEMPLLRLDMGALKSKYVGDSEANIRKALQVAEAVSPCVLWLDEIEKALAGGGEDGGVSKDQLGTVLSWMQERSGRVFVVATANDVRALPPELLRKGRFDEVFFVDLPTERERTEIAVAALREHKRSEKIDAAMVAKATEGFAGAEVAALIPDALFTAFADKERPITTSDIVAASKNVVPIAKTAAEKITALREWAKGKARLASTPEIEKQSGKVRNIDLD